MRPETKKQELSQVLLLIDKIWKLHPELRFNQLLHHLQECFNEAHNGKYATEVFEQNENRYAITFEKRYYVDLFHVEDEEFYEFLERYLDAIEADRKEHS